MLAGTLTPLCHFRYVTNITFVASVKCPVLQNFGTGLHMQIVDCVVFSPASQCERTLCSYAIKILGMWYEI